MREHKARVCAVITEETIEAARAALNQAAGVADLAELRLDYLRDFDFSNPENLRPILEDKPIRVIITCRAVEEGGKQKVDDTIRLPLLIEGAKRFADCCDIEATHYAHAVRLQPDLTKLIVSYHNFDETPAHLDSVYRMICSHPAAIHKIVTMAKTVTDAIPIFKLFEKAKKEKRNLIALAMGEPGLITRILGPSRGCFLTYASLDRGQESAPGQPTCRELNEIYRIAQITPSTHVTGIIGKPVHHSASPAMHNAAFSALDFDFIYIPLEVSDVEPFFKKFVRPDTREMDWNLRGLSVTFPHKRAVMPMLDALDDGARAIGAVNTVVVTDGRLTGHNTDVHGAMAPLEKIIKLAGEKCGVIGSGGGARAVVFGLVEAHANVTVYAFDMEEAKRLAEEFHVAVQPLDAFEKSDMRVVINATPVGMHGHSEGSSVVTREALHKRRVAYDLVYNPLETRFLQYAREEGCPTISGIEMLIAQAALQFELWTGVKPPISVMRTAALKWLDV